MTGITDDASNPNSELVGEWGVYREGERIEIERGPWSLLEIAGLPGDWPPDRSGYYLVQRAHESPHPMTWHSKRFHTSSDARDDMAWKQFIAKPVASWEATLQIPGVSGYAFNYHHIDHGCNGAGSVLECGNDHECIKAAVRQVQEVYARRRVVGMMLDAQS